MYSIARNRGGEEERKRRSSLLLVLYIAMKYMLYSSSSILQVGRLLHREDEKYSLYSIARRRERVHCLILPSSLQLSARPTPCPPAYDRGQRVGRLLHHEEERRSKLHTPTCASSPPCDGERDILLLVLYLASRLHPSLQGQG